jgi:hypothetical protein
MKKIGLLLLPLLLTSCSIQRLTLHATRPLIQNSLDALFEESDLVLAKTAIEADLKLLDGFIKTDPTNPQFLFFAVQGYTSYALGFVEDENPERARRLYLRGRDYGLRLLTQKKFWQSAHRGPLEPFQHALTHFKKEDVPALFWTANAWGSWINLSLTNPDALADLPKVQAIMERVLELEPAYFFGGAHLFLGTIYIVRPPILGGDPEKSSYHFNATLKYSSGKFLLPYVYYARYFAVQTLNEALFDSLCQQVSATSIDILPEQRLPNAIAKEKMEKLRQKKADLF